jgi:hypothetical protein
VYFKRRRKIFRVEKNKMYNEKLNDTRICRSPGIVRVVKHRRLRLAGHVTRMAYIQNTYRILVDSLGGGQPPTWMTEKELA